MYKAHPRDLYYVDDSFIYKEGNSNSFSIYMFTKIYTKPKNNLHFYF